MKFTSPMFIDSDQPATTDKASMAGYRDVNAMLPAPLDTGIAPANLYRARRTPTPGLLNSYTTDEAIRAYKLAAACVITRNIAPITSELPTLKNYEVPSRELPGMSNRALWTWEDVLKLYDRSQGWEPTPNHTSPRSLDASTNLSIPILYMASHHLKASLTQSRAPGIKPSSPRLHIAAGLMNWSQFSRLSNTLNRYLTRELGLPSSYQRLREHLKWLGYATSDIDLEPNIPIYNNLKVLTEEAVIPAASTGRNKQTLYASYVSTMNYGESLSTAIMRKPPYQIDLWPQYVAHADKTSLGIDEANQAVFDLLHNPTPWVEQMEDDPAIKELLTHCNPAHTLYQIRPTDLISVVLITGAPLSDLIAYYGWLRERTGLCLLSHQTISSVTRWFSRIPADHPELLNAADIPESLLDDMVKKTSYMTYPINMHNQAITTALR